MWRPSRLLLRSFVASAVLYLPAQGLEGCKKNYRIMSWAEYSQRSSRYTWPYIVNIYNSKGSLLYFGAKHSNNPDDEQFAEIEALWKQFQPEVAFNEGGDPAVEQTRSEAIKRAGEPGLIRFLASRDKIPVSTIDPTRAQQTAYLLKKFPAEQIKLFFVLVQYSEYGRIMQPPEPLEKHMQRVIEILSSVPGLQCAPHSISELQSTFSKNFPDLGDYRNSKPVWFDPTATGTVFNEMSRLGNEYRDKYMVSLISRTVCEKKRVFAVVGATHVVMQEPAIRRSLADDCSRRMSTPD